MYIYTERDLAWVNQQKNHLPKLEQEFPRVANILHHVLSSKCMTRPLTVVHSCRGRFCKESLHANVILGDFCYQEFQVTNILPHTLSSKCITRPLIVVHSCKGWFCKESVQANVILVGFCSYGFYYIFHKTFNYHSI